MDPNSSWYDRHVLPYLLDCACGFKPIARVRDKVITNAAGRVPDPAAALAEMRRVLCPGGKLLFAVWGEATAA